MVKKAKALSMSDVVMVRAALFTGAGPVIALIRAAEFAAKDSVLHPIATRLVSGQTLVEVAGVFNGPDTTGRVLRVMAIADQCGSAAGPIVDQVILGIRQAERMAANIRAKQAEARITAAMLIGMPVVGLVLSALSGEDARAFLFSQWGVLLLSVAGVLVALAMLWMQYLSRGVQRAARAVDPLVTKKGKQADPTAELIDLLALAMGAGMGPAQAFTAVSHLISGPAHQACDHAARAWHVAADPITDMPEALHDVGRILAASAQWGAPVVSALQMQAEDLRARANEAALESAEGLSARLVLPTTLLLMPAFLLVMVVPVLVPAVMSTLAR